MVDNATASLLVRFFANPVTQLSLAVLNAVWNIVGIPLVLLWSLNQFGFGFEYTWRTVLGAYLLMKLVSTFVPRSLTLAVRQ